MESGDSQATLNDILHMARKSILHVFYHNKYKIGVEIQLNHRVLA